MKKILILSLLMLFGITLFAQDFTIIANKNISQKNIPGRDLKNIFLGKKTNLENVKVQPVILETGAVHKNFIKSVVKKSPSQFEFFWKKAVFTGTGTPPKKFATEEEMLAYVAKTPGAIGYISSSKVDGSVNKIKPN